MSEHRHTPETIYIDCGGEYTTNDEDHRSLMRACADQWERDLARAEESEADYRDLKTAYTLLRGGIDPVQRLDEYNGRMQIAEARVKSQQDAAMDTQDILDERDRRIEGLEIVTDRQVETVLRKQRIIRQLKQAVRRKHLEAKLAKEDSAWWHRFSEKTEAERDRRITPERVREVTRSVLCRRQLWCSIHAMDETISEIMNELCIEEKTGAPKNPGPGGDAETTPTSTGKRISQEAQPAPEE